MASPGVRSQLCNAREVIGGGGGRLLSLSRDLDQRQREMQRLAGEEVIRVKCDSCVGEIGDGQRDTAVRGAHLYMHADFRFGAAEIELAAVNDLHQFLDPVSISMFRLNDDVLRLADPHSQQRVIETGNHLSDTDGEGKRLCALRRIKDFSAVELAGVMNLHCVATFYCRHLILLLFIKMLARMSIAQQSAKSQ